MRINVRTHEVIDRQALLNAALSAQLAILASENREAQRTDPVHGRRLDMLRDLTTRRVIELHAAREARSLAEARYLDGQPALFPDGVQAWDEVVHEAERLAVMVDRLAELDGLSPAELDLADAVEARTPELLADLVEPAKVTALEKLGEGERAIRIATGWVRQRAHPQLTDGLAE
jgi:hypothetical protein